MYKVAIYPGSFNPFHEGHRDVVAKTLRVFDMVIIAQGVNPEKKLEQGAEVVDEITADPRVLVQRFEGLLTDHIRELRKTVNVSAVIRGLRNNKDFEYEQNLQVAYQHHGLKVPIFYVIADQEFVDVSSTAIRNSKNTNEVG